MINDTPTKEQLKKSNIFVHEHEDHFHAHEHYHGDSGNIMVTTIGLVLHSVADGMALGASLYCNIAV